ncbi:MULTISPECIES: conjugal transfer protein TraQ [Rosenbergiella]|uniref:conjugal transfer protein TraQ n=1 Tax=Rosenbergiella TaxID=1356488 RepID=UPI001F4F8BE4|nr:MULTISPECIES: conjugal transfer protein TraQ [Rosenbergiella]
MSGDAVSALVTFASGIFSSGVSFVVVAASFFGVVGAISVLSRESALAKKVPGHSGGGKVIGVLLICGMLVAIEQIISRGSSQFGWSGASFDEVSYVSESTFGVGAQAANAMLTLIRLLGMVFALMGLMRIKRSMKDGHTGLSASEDVSSGIVRFILGVLAFCNPYLLDALQNSLGLAF